MGIQQSERLHRMIEQLLLAARFEQADVASLRAARVELDATDLVRQAGAEARARHADRRIAIETNGALPVKVAQEAVVQVLGNLLDNACKYSPDGEPVRLSGTREGAEAVLAVEDAGPGIPEAERQRIFDRFTQLDRQSQRRAGGSASGCTSPASSPAARTATCWWSSRPAAAGPASSSTCPSCPRPRAPSRGKFAFRLPRPG
jgi:two-component system OmpR family sensor kinase